MYVPLTRFLLRAPLLPAAALPRARAALLKHPLGREAIERASPSLAAAAAGAKRDRALDRYARRAAFRATPHGLLAGVGMGTLGRATAIATGTATAHRAPSWRAVAEAARALLDDEAIRERTRLRVAPSVVTTAGAVFWLGPGEPFAETRAAALDDRLAATLAVAADWRAWSEVRAALAGDDQAQDADELLLLLVDDGLLHSDLAPPVIGPPAAAALAGRLAAIGLPPPPLAEDHATLLWAARATLSRPAVTRAARLVPLLVRLQDALAPPASERLAQQTVIDALDAVTASLGGGAFEAGALATGGYGVDLAGDEAGPWPPAPPAALLAILGDAIATATAQRRREAALDRAALEAALSGDTTPLPRTAELFLAPVPAPTRGRTGERPGQGWLLGVHAPAGASFGRFAHALGAPMAAALADLDAAERRASPDAEAVDVAFTPSGALADLAAHPPVRRRALALTHWPDAADPLTLDDLAVVADPDAPASLGLRSRATGAPLVPSPLGRLRSATAPAGLPRLLVGWSLHRQHAPWALPLGPLAELAFVPRLSIDGFVVLPASWRVPEGLRTPGASGAALARWRRTARVPRFVQAGEGDELLPIDLGAAGAAAELIDQTRLYEIWPPLDAIVDRDGRRLEAVVMVVDDQSTGAPTPLMDVAPPAEAPPLAGWRTFKLFGSETHQPPLLAMVAEIVRQARAASEVDGWFFLPYVDGPGRRPHLRVRARAIGDPAAFERRLRQALEPARARGLVTALEVTDYFPERGRYRAGELPALHALFEADSDLASSLSSMETATDRILVLVRAFDALAAGLGLELGARQALAHDRRRAAEREVAGDDEARAEADALFRAHGRTLRRALGGGDPGAPQTRAFADHRDRVAAAAAPLDAASRARLLPTLLHHSAVRVAGMDRDAERLAYVCWQRTLEGLRR